MDEAAEADLAGTEEDCCELLAGLVRDGFRVVEFHLRQADLEQIFLTVTKGEVQ